MPPALQQRWQQRCALCGMDVEEWRRKGHIHMSHIDSMTIRTRAQLQEKAKELLIYCFGHTTDKSSTADNSTSKRHVTFKSSKKRLRHAADKSRSKRSRRAADKSGRGRRSMEVAAAEGVGGASSSPSICVNCCDEIKVPVHIECAECHQGNDDPKIILCVSCFSLGAELGSHRRSHDYRVRTTGDVAVFYASSTSRQWYSGEDIKLLDAAERFNLGNCWRFPLEFRDDVTPMVNPKLSMREVKEHYDKCYLHGTLGRFVLGRGDRADLGPSRPRRLNIIDDSLVQSTASASSTSLLNSPPIRQNVCKANHDDLRMLAYMPHRDDFETEWKNESEQDVAKLSLAPDDDELDKKVKQAHIDMYTRTVAERRRRKAVARDYDLVLEFFKKEKPNPQQSGWKYTPAQYSQMKQKRELAEQLKKHSQFLPAADFKALTDGLLKERQLKDRIEELQEMRKNGVKSLEGKRKFELCSDTAPLRKRRGRKRMAVNHGARKANLKWQRIRRWQKKLPDAE